MTRIVAVAVAVLASATSVACFHPQNDLRGQCSSDTDCGPAARCDKTVSPPVCVASTCSPACDSSSVCDTQTVTCKPVTTPSIVVITPAANAFVGGRVQITATARAPAGVAAVTFQVTDAGGTHSVTGAGVAPNGSADFSATLNLVGTGFVDGPATIVALLSYPGGTLPSESVAVSIDMTPPSVTALEVFLAGAGDPNKPGMIVIPPPRLSDSITGFSGHDGTNFILSDQVHMKGTVAGGGAGISCASLQYRIDGIDASGIVRAPTTQPLPGCTANGATTVDFDLPAISLNDITKYGRLGKGSGELRLIILATDDVVGTPNAIPETSGASVSIPVTRLWWSRQFKPSPVAVSGLAIHPNTDLIVTANITGAPSVWALYRDGPFHPTLGIRWSVAAGSVMGAPAVGTDAAGQPVYVACNSVAQVSAFE